MQQTLKTIFQQQKNNYKASALPSADIRIQQLKKLKDCIHKYESSIFQALADDLRKSKFEAAITEVYFVYSEIDFAIKHLRQWVRPKRANSTLSSLFAKNRIEYQPKGTSLIISPWNYPFQLSMSPLVSALAAGNTVIIKPSEYSTHTADIIAKILDETFTPSTVHCALGNQEVSTALLQLPFDHIFFTGSTQVGKIVMKAAATHLSAVTLELGGKSPVLIHPSANLKKAAEKVAWGKLINAGQTCIAPDYILIHPAQEEQFIQYYKAAVTRFVYQDNGDINHETYAKIINPKHIQHLHTLVDVALQQGAKIGWKGAGDSHDTFSPTILQDIAIDSDIMQEEIFGPILPIVRYKTVDEAIGFIQDRPKPLALYIFSEDSKSIKHILSKTSSGGACVNDVLLHVSNPHLPFGGINHSGTGSCHGYFGFKTFSHERSIMYQSSAPISKLIYPPYTGKDWILNLLKRML